MRHRTTVPIVSKITYDMVVTESFYFHDSSRWFKRTPLQFFLDNYLWYSEKLFSRILPELLFSRSSRPDVLCKKGVITNFAKFSGKHLCQVSLLTKSFYFWKKRLWHRCFPVNFAKFVKTPFLQNTSGGWLLPFLHHIEANCFRV